MVDIKAYADADVRAVIEAYRAFWQPTPMQSLAAEIEAVKPRAQRRKEKALKRRRKRAGRTRR